MKLLFGGNAQLVAPPPHLIYGPLAICRPWISQLPRHAHIQGLACPSARSHAQCLDQGPAVDEPFPGGRVVDLKMDQVV